MKITPPSGVVSFLFTDIEGSTRRWDADAEAMRSALEAHDAVLRESIEKYEGWLFKHTGDGVCAAFASPRSAVDAAVAAQRALELPVRMGIATGEAELRDGDYFGAVLNRAARLMAAGHGVQVLLDGATAGLLAGADLIDLGPRRLRDIAKPVAVFQVRADGLPTDFPPLRTADSIPGNLRLATSSFVGRESELVDLRAALEGNRLVTLTGVGGVGKTRLALETASRLADDFPDGVFMIELAAVGDPAAVPEAAAAAMGMVQQPGLSLAASVAAALEGRSRLLVFDNCEHVLDAAAELIEAILQRSSTVKVIATSREGLRLDDEQLWPVPSLDTRADADSAAAALFVERASAVAPGTSVTADGDAVAEICRRLDGIPLAIELAASRMLSMNVTDVRDRLDDRFRLLVGSRRGLERHQTLRHAVQWSFELLNDAETRLLTRCSVFAGGFDVLAASGVVGTDDEFATLDILDALVRKSLLTVDRASQRARYSMLETIRQFAEEQLVTAGEADDARTAHAAYYASQENSQLELWDSPRQRESYEWFSAELPNLRTAFRWAADNADLDTAIAIAICATFLSYWVEQYEPNAWAIELLEPAANAAHPRLAQLYLAAAQCYLTGHVDDFRRYVAAGEAAAESSDFDDVPIALWSPLSGGFMTCCSAEQAVQWCRNMIARYPDGFSWVCANLAFSLIFAGNTDDAMAVAKDGMAEAEGYVNPAQVQGAILAYGQTHRAIAPAAAYSALKRGLESAQRSGNRQMESVLAMTLSSVAAVHGEPMDAFEYLALSTRTYFDSGSLGYVAGSAGLLAALLDRLGNYEEAATISGFVDTPIAFASFPEIGRAIAHIREVLGDEAYETLARAGASMTNAAKAAYALDRIDEARAVLMVEGPRDERP